jgi:hypothetical protein
MNEKPLDSWEIVVDDEREPPTEPRNAIAWVDGIMRHSIMQVTATPGKSRGDKSPKELCVATYYIACLLHISHLFVTDLSCLLTVLLFSLNKQNVVFTRKAGVFDGDGADVPRRIFPKSGFRLVLIGLFGSNLCDKTIVGVILEDN